MSHLVTITTKVGDANAVRSACKRLRLPPPTQGTHRLFSGQVSGLGVQLQDWKYPVVCKLDTGQLQFDNYDGRWGDQTHLDAFLQSYTVEKAKIEARRKGHSVTEQPLQDGSIKLTINVA